MPCAPLMLVPLPAHKTKHLPLLVYPFHGHLLHLSQLDNGQTNGSALWLGAQCLSLYLADLLKNKNKFSAAVRPRAIELGSGVGLSACVLFAAAFLSLAHFSFQSGLGGSALGCCRNRSSRRDILHPARQRLS